MSMKSIDLSTTSSIDFESTLGDNAYGKLAVVSGVPRITIDGNAAMPQLLRAHFVRPLPDVKVKGGEVRIRYPRYSLLNWLVYWRQPLAEITINASIPWIIELRGGVSSFAADLRQVQLSGLDLRGGISHLWANLPEPAGTVIIRVGGGVSDMTIHRPESIPLEIQVRGGIGSLTLDKQHFGAMGNRTRLKTPGYRDAINRYDIQISGGVSNISIDKQALVNQIS